MFSYVVGLEDFMLVFLSRLHEKLIFGAESMNNISGTSMDWYVTTHITEYIY